MRYTNTFGGSSILAGRTMQLLNDQRICKIPQNYAIWYEYLKGDNQDLNNNVNDLLKREGKFTDQLGKEIYSRFFTFKNESETIRETNRLVQKSIDGIMDEIDSASGGFSEYENILTDFTANASDPDSGNLKDTITNILVATGKISEDASELRSSLNKAGQKITDLQKRLEAVEKETLTDELTGISNRRSFNCHIEEIWRCANRTGNPFCLVMADIDHFKQFNDDYGHQFGDEVLKFVAKMLNSYLPGSAFAARYGGEEFAILLPSTNMETARAISENIRQQIASQKLLKRNSGEQVGHITMSFGIADYKGKEDIEALIDRADAALYIAKGKGRNYVQTASVQYSATG